MLKGEHLITLTSTLLFVSGVAAGASQHAELKRKQEERRRFQDQELITARPMTRIFNPGDPPRIIWRDVDEVRRLGADGVLHVRWFDRDLSESAKPTRPGRWGAFVKGIAPNGTPMRRALTFYCRPPMFLFFLFPPDFSISFPQLTGPHSNQVWHEHAEELNRLPKDLLFRSVNDDEAAIILFSGLAAAKPLGRPALATESMAVANDDYHLALKLKVLGLTKQVRPLKPPRRRPTPASVLRQGSPAEAGVRPDTAAKIRDICKAWADDSKEPFVTLVARHGVIVIQESFGVDADKKPLALDFRSDVFSITKTVTAILFSQFVDQGLIGLDDSVATVFPDYPRGSPHVPTFRQCLTHMSGLSGHGDWGGVRNPHLENIILGGIDVNEPGKTYNYSGMGFDLTGKAMEIVTGHSALHLYRDYLFEPLGMGDVPMEHASSGARLTARELGSLAQWLVNRGSYGELEFVSPATFAKLLPEPLSRRYPGVTEEEGIGMHWIRPLKAGAKAGSTRPEDLIFTAATVGHGSLAGCILDADLERGIVVAQVRKAAGLRYTEWSTKFFQAIADGTLPQSLTLAP
jgi:CubicO group peptidase (beta-lactamase class C family)